MRLLDSTFDIKKNLRALKPDSDLDQVLATNLKILEMGKLRRSGNTPATQLSRLLQLEAYSVLDTDATCSASNDPAEITSFLPSTVLLKPAVGPPQYMC